MGQEQKDPAKQALQSLEKGVGQIFKAAEHLATAVKQEVDKNGGIGRAVDDAGKEVVRAASSVATKVGAELGELGRRAQENLESVSRSNGFAPQGGARAGGRDPGVRPEDWPKTREEYEKKYGRDGDDWPKTPQEYVDKYGRPPRPKTDDPGFRIADDK